MKTLDWSKNTFSNESSQKLLDEKVNMLLDGVLREKDEYQKEKAIKSFCEGLGYLEKLLQYQREVHRSQLDLVKISQNPSDYQKKIDEIANIIESEIKRQYRHFSTFL